MATILNQTIMKNITGNDVDERYITHLNSYMGQYGINTNPRIQFFIAIACGETGGFQHFRERMSYSTTERLMTTFGNKFTNNEDVGSYVNSPARLANRVYGGINGNNQLPLDSTDEQCMNSDGYKYRGGGIFQLTFKSNYEEYAHGIGIGRENVERLITEGDTFCVFESNGAVRSACHYVQNRNNGIILTHADTDTWGSFTAACRAVGICPDGNNYQKKHDYLARCRAYIGGNGIPEYNTDNGRSENTRLVYLTSTELNVFLEAKRKISRTGGVYPLIPNEPLPPITHEQFVNSFFS